MARALKMKIATFNINNINKRLPNLLDWLKVAKPDVVCLQEFKTEQNKFPDEPLEPAGYFAVWTGQKTWNGSERRVDRSYFGGTIAVTSISISIPGHAN